MGKLSAIRGRMLIVDDDKDVLQAAKLLLKRHFAQVDVDTHPERIPDWLAQHSYDIILLDMNFTRDVASGHEGFMWLDKIRRLDPNAVVVMITAYGDIEMAVRAIKMGATDFVIKPWDNEKLLATLMAALQLSQSRREVATLRLQQKTLTTDTEPQDILYQSPTMQRVVDTLMRVAKTDANILITGENGTGKEVVARALHRHSLRSEKIFVNVDLGALSETLFESELFGHNKGAFTDAKEDRAGRFEVAHTGTLFLDEIGNLSLPLQAKLLAALQNREVTRLGSHKAKPIDIRLICATNRSPHDMVAAGSFRQDLLYRINTIEIQLPPLRERIPDIGLLARHYMAFYAKKYQKNVASLSDEALLKMEAYAWPGNVRELQHTIERAVILCNTDSLLADDLLLHSTPRVDLPSSSAESYNLEDIEKNTIMRVLAKHNGNISLVAKELGLTRASVYRRLEKYGL